jgi:hypothetical protein
MSHDRFDLEQAIIQCWGVCDDLKAGIDPQVLSNYYDAKFNKLWDIFEELVYEHHYLNNTSKTQEPASETSA